MRDIIEPICFLIGVLGIVTFLGFVVYANTIGEKTPAEQGLVQKVEPAECSKVIWVKP